jgi:tetratricopeptide (TPR) repeat protein
MPADRSLPCWAQRLIELRRARMWSPADLARELKKRRDDLPSARSLAHMIQLDWETGKHRPGPRYRLLLAAVYGADEHEIFGEPSDTAVARPDVTTAGRPDRPGVGLAEDVVDVFARIQKFSKTVNPEIIQQLLDNARDTIVQYERLDHAGLVPALMKQRAWVDSFLDECSHPTQRKQLFEIAAATSGVLGYVCVGRNNFPLARAYCFEAFQLGDFAQDANLQAWARGLQSFCEYYAGQYDEALRFAEDGLKYARSGPQSVRLTVNGAARAMGKLGNAEGVHRAADRAYDLISCNDAPSGVPSSISFGCYSAAQTAGNVATAYVSLGMPEKAQRYIELALPDMRKADSPWSRSLVMIDMASALIQPKDADLDRAAGIIVEALTISASRPVISVQQRASDFVCSAAGRWGNIKQVSAIRDAISAMKALR